MSIFNRIWAGIMTVLMFLFPFFFKPPVQPPGKLDVNASVETVINAIKTRDISAIEAFMCKNIKDNVPNLQAEISKIIDAIEGEITSHSSEKSDFFYVSSGGKVIEQSISISDIYTSVGKYQLNIIWEFYNNFSIAERGIRQIALFIPPSGTEEYIELVRIRATEGIGHVHN